MSYESAEEYIRGEYGEAIEDALAIINRFKPQWRSTETREEHDATTERMAIAIAGYFTGCLSVDGTPRVAGGRPTRKESK